ncbi:MAG: nucleotide sugar dehydrogenase, partial [bacterium]
VVLRSTVLPGTTEKLLIPVLEEYSKQELGEGFKVAFNPEFLREGSALKDFNNSPLTVIGELPDLPADEVYNLWSGLQLDAQIFRVSIQTAELLKYASNVFHALKITFANEIGQIAKAVEVDARQVMELFKQDKVLNTSGKYLTPGFAFGGSCLVKDLRALVSLTTDAKLNTPVLSQILPSNEAQIQRAAMEVLSLRNGPVGIIGLTFKPETDDVRESPTLYLVEILQQHGVDLYLWDSIVDISKLHGANRTYARNMVRDLDKIWLNKLEDLLNKVNIIVVHHRRDLQIIEPLARDKAVIFLGNIH